MKKILVICGLVILLVGCMSRNTNIKHNQKINGTKYAFILIASARGERGDSLTDPIDKNGFWLGSVSIYNSLRNMGFKAKNIRVLYSDGKPDFEDKLKRLDIQKIKKEQFNRKYDNRATKENIKAQLKRFSKLVDNNDIFALYIGTHGNPNLLEIEEGDTDWTSSEVQESVISINPKFGILYSDACHSGAFIEKLNLPNYILLSTTGEHTYGWGDRHFSGGTYFFESLRDGESDTNVDGDITIREAYERAQIRAYRHMGRIDDYLRYRYNYLFSDYELFEKGKVSVKQKIIIGKNVSDQYIFYRVW